MAAMVERRSRLGQNDAVIGADYGEEYTTGGGERRREAAVGFPARDHLSSRTLSLSGSFSRAVGTLPSNLSKVRARCRRGLVRGRRAMPVAVVPGEATERQASRGRGLEQRVRAVTTVKSGVGAGLFTMYRYSVIILCTLCLSVERSKTRCCRLAACFVCA